MAKNTKLTIISGINHTKRETTGLVDDCQENDTEDGYVCMHLRLFDDDVLVVADGKTVRALQRARDLWNSKATQLPATCRGMTTDHYVEEYST